MKLAQKAVSLDGSVKHLWELSGRAVVESTYFQLNRQPHLCLSSQAGCNVRCVFCETGRQRNQHNLSSHEIVAQAMLSRDDVGLSPGIFKAVLFAGMGEPLLNFRSVAAAAEELLSRRLTHEVTLTTSGIVPRMRELASVPIRLLNVSLHATTNEIRDRLIPINRQYPLEEVLDAAMAYRCATGNPVTINYLLLAGVNDSDRDVERMLGLLDPAMFAIKLKVWNALSGSDLIASPAERFDAFESALTAHGFHVTVDRSQGTDIAAGCGQLGASLGATAIGRRPARAGGARL
jgi:23S rRNA (adenine2503-C2)-methyltransferase